jgi:high-affinity iron transporter
MTMQKLLSNAMLMSALIASSACTEDDQVDAARLESPQARARGRELFVQHCALCHGERADGRGARREGLSAPPADFTRPAWRKGRTPRQVFEAIRDGVPSRSMPAWRGLGDEALWDLTAYLLSLGGEAR